MSPADVWYFAGDPGDTPRLVPKPAGVAAFGAKEKRLPVVAKPAPAATLFQTNVLDVARTEAEAAIRRASNPARVAEYLSLVGFHDDGSAAYCGAGVAWAVCKAYCDLNNVAYSDANRLAVLKSVRGDIDSQYFLTTAWIPDTVEDAKARGTFLTDSRLVKPGYLVFFNWNDCDKYPRPFPEHVGLVESIAGSQVATIEFNTSIPSGPHKGEKNAVAQRRRDLSLVVNYVKTY
jgi:hypothetical protein